MKLKITTEQGEQLMALQKKVKAAQAVIEISLADHRKALEAINAEAESIWTMIGAEYDIDFSEHDLVHVMDKDGHYVITKSRQEQADG